MEFTKKEIKDFKQNWGQTQTEICNCLEFPVKHSLSDELIINTGNYFWIEKNKRWFNKQSSLFTAEEAKIADYLCHLEYVNSL